MEFKRIGKEDRPIIQKYLTPLKIENADYCFTTLYLWGRHGKIRYAEEDGALYLLYHFPEQEPFFSCPVPIDFSSPYAPLVKKAFSYLKELGVKRPSIHTVTTPFAERIKEECPELIFSRTRYADDYIYDKESLLTLRGNKLHAKRNHINRFLQEYNGRWEYVPINSSMLNECMSLYDEWQEHKDLDELEELYEFDEKLTVELAIKRMDEFCLKGGAILIDGVLSAFTIGEKVTDDMMTVHIEKANTEINGLYPLINREFVAHECGFAKYINREDDMGREGLRKAKLSYYPVRMIEKYKVTEAE